MLRPLPLFDPPLPTSSLEEVLKELGNCTRCKLSRSRHCIVFGQGRQHARMLLIGEAPGENEDMTGMPFSGRAGRLLTELLEEVDIDRQLQCYIANIVKCRPPKNRKPEEEEIQACRPFLEKQIRSVNPEVIVALGGYAAQWLLGGTQPITKIRGKIWSYRGIKVIPTFHPAYLLRSPEETKKVLDDLRLAKEQLL
jgi:uracil-DNA glycosylase family 4